MRPVPCRTQLSEFLRSRFARRPPSVSNCIVDLSFRAWQTYDDGGGDLALPLGVGARAMSAFLESGCEPCPHHEWLLPMFLLRAGDASCRARLEEEDRQRAKKENDFVEREWRRCYDVATTYETERDPDEEEREVASARGMFLAYASGKDTDELESYLMSCGGVEETRCVTFEHALICAMIRNGDEHLRSLNSDIREEAMRREKEALRAKMDDEEREAYRRLVRRQAIGARTIVGAWWGRTEETEGRSQRANGAACTTTRSTRSGTTATIGTVRTQDPWDPVVDLVVSKDRCVSMKAWTRTPPNDSASYVVTESGSRFLFWRDVRRLVSSGRELLQDEEGDDGDAGGAEDRFVLNVAQELASNVACNLSTSSLARVALDVVADGESTCLTIDSSGVVRMDASGAAGVPRASSVVCRSGMVLHLDPVANLAPTRALALPDLVVGRGSPSRPSSSPANDSKARKRRKRRTSVPKPKASDVAAAPAWSTDAQEPCNVRFEELMQVVGEEEVSKSIEFNFASRVGLILGEGQSARYEPSKDAVDPKGNVAVYCDTSNGRSGKTGTKARYDVKYRTFGEDKVRKAFSHGRYWDVNVANFVCNWLVTQPKRVRETNHSGRRLMDLVFPPAIRSEHVGRTLRCTTEGLMSVSDVDGYFETLNAYWGKTTQPFECESATVVRAVGKKGRRTGAFGDAVELCVAAPNPVTGKVCKTSIRIRNPVDVDRTMPMRTASSIVQADVGGEDARYATGRASVDVNTSSLPMPSFLW